MSVLSAITDAVRSGEMPWPSWIEVDLDAIAHNVHAMKRLVGPTCAVAAVVKAQAYGHGAIAVARAALEAGASWLAVARVREAEQLRAAGLACPILVLGPAEAPEIETTVKLNLWPTVVSVAQLRALSKTAVATGREVRVHVKLGTGLNRFGVPPEEGVRLLAEARETPGITVQGVYSHFATADEEELSFARMQVEVFSDAVSILKRTGHDVPLVHMAASAAAMALEESHFDAIRLGISLYGVYPSPHLRSGVDLRPALTMHSRIARVFELSPGDSVGYGRTFIADRRMRVGLVPVGYADGLPRSHSNRGAVLVGGQRARLVGRVSMDQCVVDLTAHEGVDVGAPVVVIGSQGQEAIDIDAFASLSGTISYEALTSLGDRVPRVYTQGGRPVSVGFLDEASIIDM